MLSTLRPKRMQTKNRRIDKIYIHISVRRIKWHLRSMTVGMCKRLFGEEYTFAGMHWAKRIGRVYRVARRQWLARRIQSTEYIEVSVRWIRKVFKRRKDTLVSRALTSAHRTITSYLPLKVKDKLLTLSVSVKTFIYLFEPKTCRRSRHRWLDIILYPTHSHIRFCPISIFIPDEMTLSVIRFICMPKVCKTKRFVHFALLRSHVPSASTRSREKRK